MVEDFQEVLTRNDEKFLKLYGNRVGERFNRTLLFIDNVPSSKVFKHALLPPTLGVTIGGTCGGLLGLGLAGPKGAAIGAGSGVGIGLLSGGTYAGYKTRKEYKKWLAQYRNDEIFTDLLYFFMKRDELTEFLCPLTKEPMHYPFIDPWGHSYECEAIRSWIKEHKSSPIAKAPLSLSQVRPNYAMMGKQAKIYAELLENEMQKVSMTIIQREGITSLLTDLRKQIDHCFRAENKILYEKLLAREISMKTYAAQLSLVANMLNK